MEDVSSATRPITASLARRLAAAADGYRNGEVVWFTARYVAVDEDFDISEGLEGDRPAAPEDPDYGVFGPFQNDADQIKRTPVVKVTLHLSDSTERTFAAAKCDAIFWSSSAIRKFAIPHYAEYIGLDYAKKIRDDFGQANVSAFAHGPNTEYELVKSADGQHVMLIG